MGSLAAPWGGYIRWRWFVFGPPGSQAQGQREIIVVTFPSRAVRIVASLAIDFDCHVLHFSRKNLRKWQTAQHFQFAVLDHERQIENQISFGDTPRLPGPPSIQIFDGGCTLESDRGANRIHVMFKHFIDNGPPNTSSVHN